MTEQEAVDNAFKESFPENYRGYTRLPIAWSVIGNRFQCAAFMLNSPCHPRDIMCVVGELEDGAAEVFGTNAALTLRRYVDIACDNPKMVKIFSGTPVWTGPLLAAVMESKQYAK